MKDKNLNFNREWHNLYSKACKKEIKKKRRRKQVAWLAKRKDADCLALSKLTEYVGDSILILQNFSY